MSDIDQVAEDVLQRALAYPEAWQDDPWGDLVVKVRKKIFVFVGLSEDRLNITVKLPHSMVEALDLPNAKPTGYGLGRHGWVSLSFARGEPVPHERIVAWMDESYRAVALKSLIKRLDSAG